MAEVARGVPVEGRRVLLVAFPLTIALWLAIWRWWPAPTATDPGSRLATALGWICAAGLFTLAAAIEAVAHERLQSSAFDPLAGRDSPRLKINARYLQNTLEQFALFAPGLIGLAWYGGTDGAMRTVPATALTWIATRFAFWIGYHRGAAYRAWGVPGLLIPTGLLLYATCRFGYDMGGTAGAIVPLAAYLGLEIVLFRTTRPADP